MDLIQQLKRHGSVVSENLCCPSHSWRSYFRERTYRGHTTRSRAVMLRLRRRRQGQRRAAINKLTPAHILFIDLDAGGRRSSIHPRMRGGRHKQDTVVVPVRMTPWSTQHHWADSARP